MPPDAHLLSIEKPYSAASCRGIAFSTRSAQIQGYGAGIFSGSTLAASD